MIKAIGALGALGLFAIVVIEITGRVESFITLLCFHLFNL